jgi:WD40 repeat protein
MEVDSEEGPSGSVGMEVDEVTENIQWRFSQIKGNLDNEDSPTDADLISCVEFSPDGEFLATGDKGGRVVIFQRDQSVSNFKCF